jgi:hypothetical protein
LSLYAVINSISHNYYLDALDEYVKKYADAVLTIVGTTTRKYAVGLTENSTKRKK